MSGVPVTPSPGGPPTRPAHALPDYAELHCLTNFSFQRGASHPAELVQRAAELGYTALAITDECSLSGVVRAHVAARETGLPLIIGAEMRLTLPPPAGAPRHAAPVPHARLVVLGIEHAYSKEPGNAAETKAKTILEFRGNAPRLELGVEGGCLVLVALDLVRCLRHDGGV